MTKRIDVIRQAVTDSQAEAERELENPDGEATGLSVRVRTEGGTGIELIQKETNEEPQVFYLTEQRWKALRIALAWLEADV